MLDLAFRMAGAIALEHAATATVALQVDATASAPVQALLLRCQVQIEPAARSYANGEAERLAPVLGPRERRATPRLLWANVSQNVPGFEGESRIEIHLPCALDLRTGPASYLDALDGGDVPLALLFSGTAFHEGANGALTAAPVHGPQIPFALPVATCREALARHHGDATLLPVRRDVLARLRRYGARRASLALDDALASLLDLAERAP